MRALILVPMVLILSGFGSCQTKPDPSVVTRTEYVVRQAPDSMYKLPPQVTAIDVDTASQREVSIWITDSEERTLKLEQMLGALKIFFNQPVELPPTK